MIAYGTFLPQGQKPGQSLYSPLKYQRLLRGWSQQDVVDELYKLCIAHGRTNIGLTVDTVRCWENGRHLPSPFYRKHLLDPIRERSYLCELSSQWLSWEKMAGHACSL